MVITMFHTQSIIATQENDNQEHCYTTLLTGGVCYFDTNRTDCAICEPGGCQCGEYSPSGGQQCVECGNGDDCVTLDRRFTGVNTCVFYTRNSTGGVCYFDTNRTDCAICEEGGCQCMASSPSRGQQCVKCGNTNDCNIPCYNEEDYCDEPATST
jgi:hypothetical protein